MLSVTLAGVACGVGMVKGLHNALAALTDSGGYPLVQEHWQRHLDRVHTSHVRPRPTANYRDIQPLYNTHFRR